MVPYMIKEDSFWDLAISSDCSWSLIVKKKIRKWSDNWLSLRPLKSRDLEIRFLRQWAVTQRHRWQSLFKEENGNGQNRALGNCRPSRNMLKIKLLLISKGKIPLFELKPMMDFHY